MQDAKELPVSSGSLAAEMSRSSSLYSRLVPQGLQKQVNTAMQAFESGQGSLQSITNTPRHS